MSKRLKLLAKKSKYHLLDFRQIERRVFCLFLLQFLVLFLVFSRLVFLQIFKYKKYKTLSLLNAYKYDLITPLRGLILDRNNIPLAKDYTSKKLIFMPKSIQDIEPAMLKIVKYLDVKPKSIERYIARLEVNFKRNKYDKIVILKKMSSREIIKVSADLDILPFFFIEKSLLRRYLFNQIFAHVVGYTNHPTEEELDGIKKKVDMKIKTSDLYIGRFGVEKVKNDKLNGQYGIVNIEVYSNGKMKSSQVLSEPKNGENSKLTLDLKLQSFVYEQMLKKQYNGACVVIDVKTGELISMVSMPSFNPNNIVHLNDELEWKKLLEQEKDGVFLNKSISSLYPPGSTVKPAVALYGMENGLNPKTTYYCTGKHLVGNRIFHCWKKEGHGYVDLEKAIKASCSAYFYNLAVGIDHKELFKYMDNFFSYNKASLGLDGQIIGNANIDKFLNAWRKGDTVNFSIGQGYNQKTILQLAIMSARIASGYRVEPSIFFNTSEKLFTKLPIEDKNLDFMRTCMFNMINAEDASARWLKSKKYNLCGKTGSAQVVSRRIEWSEMLKGNVEHRLKNHSLFTGFGPYEDPKFAIAVLVEYGIAGLVTSAKLGIDTLEYALDNC